MYNYDLEHIFEQQSLLNIISFEFDKLTSIIHVANAGFGFAPFLGS